MVVLVLLSMVDVSKAKAIIHESHGDADSKSHD